MAIEKRNLVIMCIVNFFVAASATMILPFLSIYIDTFGEFTDAYVQRWAGFVFGITFLIAFFVSPFWGRFGDKFGRKRILLITGYGIAISIFLMGYIQSVLGLFILRLIMGIVTGFIPTSIALIAAQTKKEEAGKVLGTLQMGTVSGGLFGPMIGGVLADSFGFAYTFIITAIIIAAATTIVHFGIKENRNIADDKDRNKRHSMREVLKMIFTNKVLLIVMFVSFIIQTANFSIQPQLALYVDQLIQAENIAFLAGMAFSVTGLGNLMATRFWGILGDRIGHEKVLLTCLILAGLFFLPQAFVTNIWQLVFLRFLFGIQIGGVIPVVTAYIRKSVPLSIQGEVLGYNQSFRFLGNVAGPVVGGLISGYWTIASVFYFSTSLFLIAAICLFICLRVDNTGQTNNR
ncbi:MFS transporter [Evansella cellulosilytica]|uniref:MFS transporter n=1 Tax=Evansella cellulosilytica TaxID=1413 RepID=UPI00059FD5D4|nr:MFS transporter [Evansella cellulosilytica]